MGDIANIVDLRGFGHAKPLNVAYPSIGVHSKWARLVPGMSSAPGVAETSEAPHSDSRPLPRRIIAELRPKFFDGIPASMVPLALLDLMVVTLAYAGFSHVIAPGGSTMNALGIYLSCFLVLAGREGLYSKSANAVAENCAVLRTSIWSTLFTIFLLRAIAGKGSSLMIVGLGAGSVLALLAARNVRRTIQSGDTEVRNVLIVGSGPRAQKIADAIHRNPSGRELKGFMAEHHLRNVYGASMLSRIAREQFIDEIIIAGSDPLVMQVAADQARHGGLDIKIAPEIGGLAGRRQIACEDLCGIPLLKIHEQQFPECSLAMKRVLDVALAAAGLFALSPMFLLVAALIAFDSRGPVLYSASRIGRKGRRFVCYKFRSMVRDADASKDSLRSCNQRHGAFFKIANDPRITGVGRFLRRYSLDELPQFWNVLIGDMSLVGPRPHPPDDVSLYELQHLQRLDFAPGLTGLWQVTARRDPSFERSVALDVEYIKNWNLRLDARILWRTLFAVLEGSGA